MFQYWLKNNLFSWQWWLLLVLVISAYVIWWKLVNKDRLKELILVALFVMVISGLLDLYGTQFILWGYPNMILPGMPPLFFDNYAVLPLAYSLIYQYCSKWKTYLIAVLILAAVSSFVVEPILVWIRVYDLHNWNYIYSFLVLSIMGIGVKALVDKVKRIKAKHSNA